MDELLQPFPKSFARDGNLFVALSGQIVARRSQRMHRHDFYELVLIWEGACSYFSDFEIYPAARGDLLFVSPGQLHDYFLDAGSVRVLIIGFRPSVLPEVAHHLVHVLPFNHTKRSPVVSLSSESKTAVMQLFNMAHERFDQEAPGWEPIVTAYLQTILSEAAYQLPANLFNRSASAAEQLAQTFQQLLEAQFLRLRQVQDYADRLGVTSNYLVKTIREVTSMTPKQMLQDRLLLEAKRLLVHTPYPVVQISDLLHYPTSTAFARWFKKQTGQTPTEFRKRPFALPTQTQP